MLRITQTHSTNPRSHHIRRQTTADGDAEGCNFGEKDERSVNGTPCPDVVGWAKVRSDVPTIIRCHAAWWARHPDCVRRLCPPYVSRTALGTRAHVPLGFTLRVGIARAGSSGQACRG